MIKIICKLLLGVSVLRIFLQPLLLDFINLKLNNASRNYSISLEDLTIHLLLGEYQLHGLKVVNRDTKLKVLIFKTLSIDIAWKNLLFYDLDLDLELDSGHVKIINEAEAELEDKIEREDQQSWVTALKLIVPLKLSSVVLKDISVTYIAQLAYKSTRKNQSTTLSIKKGEVRNILHPQRSKKKLSPIVLVGSLNNHADFNLEGGINLESNNERFDLNLVIRNFQLKTLNKLFYVYIPLDITEGLLDSYLHISGSIKKSKGYIKTFITDLDIISEEQEYKSPSHMGIEFISGLSNWLLSILNEKNIAFKLPLKIKNKEFEFDSSEAFWSTLENSYDSLERGFDAN